MNRATTFILSAIFTVTLTAASASAFAANGGEGNNTGCNGVGNANSPCAGGGSTTPPTTTPPDTTPPTVVQGPRGEPGAPGRDGKDGESVAGKDGRDGQDGKPGAVGATGAAGRDATLPADIVTQGQLNSLRDQINATDKRASAGTAAAIGFASIPQTVEPGSSGIGAGAGCYRSECGLALGVSHRTEGGDWHLKGAVTVDSRGGAGVGAGALFTWK